MTIICDTREKPKAIQGILEAFKSNHVECVRSKLWIGDYQSLDNSRLVVDRKQNLLELASNVGQDSARFKAELKRAKQYGVKIVFLCEHGYGINSLEDVRSWENPRLKESKLAISGERLYQLLSYMANYYGVEFRFCDKKDTGNKIIEILGGGYGA